MLSVNKTKGSNFPVSIQGKSTLKSNSSAYGK